MSTDQSISENVDQLQILLKYNMVAEGLGVNFNFEASSQLKEWARPKFSHARSVRFALKEAIEKKNLIDWR